MSEEFIIGKTVRRRRRKRLAGTQENPTPTPVPPNVENIRMPVVKTPSPPSTPTPVPNAPIKKPVAIEKDDSDMPIYLLDPPDYPEDVNESDRLKGHTNELICAFKVAQDVLGSSFRPKESNLAVGIIRV
jgi:hypothetical protein